MTYELAKKLKDAGFPQSKEGYYYALSGKYKYPSIPCEGDYEKVSIPTLSELIESCGGEFRLLFREHEESGWKSVSWNEWLEGTGLTAEEAVANLWLALQGKGIRG